MTPEEIYRQTSSATSLADTGKALLNHIKQGVSILDRDRSIIAQNAGTTAANLLSAAINSGAIQPRDADELLSEFDSLRTAVFNGTLTLAGAEAVVERFEGGPAPAAASSGYSAPAPSGGGSLPNADVEIKVGKHRGQTIGQVYDSGADGVSYLEWASEKLNNDWLRGRIAEFLAAAA